ncbi:MAG: GTPase ObgE [Myxococcales bacterium]|nr:GTPase ObgE [Myxococcota bacterium]MDW8280726.1 GTPase ObgE [Myxococcales bacterium]
MHFVDECTIQVRGGRGGNGCVAFRRSRHNPRGGPCGGNGGDGGDVVLVADPRLTTLLDLSMQREYRAEAGGHGQGRDRHGRRGADRIVAVPVGTVVQEVTGERIADLCEPGQRLVVARGGRGGRGNLSFVTATCQAPWRAEPGEPGQERTLRLELRLLADVGLLGYPNVGKSTLIARVSRARPKIADYPFTTLRPHLGVVQLPGEGRSFVLADVPGLIEGAHEGRGLGLRFLRHLSRARVLLHLLAVSPDPGREPERDLDVLNEELRRHDPDLAARPQIVALAQIDLPEARAVLPGLRERLGRRGLHLHAISAVTGEGVAELMEAAWAAARAR